MDFIKKCVEKCFVNPLIRMSACLSKLCEPLHFSPSGFFCLFCVLLFVGKLKIKQLSCFTHQDLLLVSNVSLLDCL